MTNDNNQQTKSTKVCPSCGCANMINYISTNTKQCSNCLKPIAWPLDKGQKKLL